MEQEVHDGETAVYARVQTRGSSTDQGSWRLYARASEDLGVHPTQLRNWVKQFADDPQHAFPGQGQMKPEQLEIARLKREVAKLKAERDILKNCPGRWHACAG